MFTFCSLQGALSDSTASQSLLELDGGVKVLIDVGWDETFDVDKLKELEKYDHLCFPPLNFSRGNFATQKLNVTFQTSSNYIADPSDTRDRVAHRCLCALLQELSSIYSNPRIRDPPCHRSWTNPYTGLVRLISRRGDRHRS